MINLFSQIKIIFRNGGVVFTLFLLMCYVCTWYGNSVYWCTPFLAVLLVINMQLKFWDKISSYLLFFSISYCMILVFTEQVQTMFGLLGILCAPTACYLYGKKVVDCNKTDESILITLVMLLVLAFVLRLGLNTIEDIRITGFVNVLRAMELDKDLSATLYGLTVSVSLGGIAIFFMIPNRYKSLTAWGYLLAFVLGLLTIVHLVNRSGLFTVVISLIVASLYLSKMNLKKLIFYMLVFMGLVVAIMKFGLIDEQVISAYSNRAENDIMYYGENNASFAGRGERWVKSLAYLFTNPFGWAYDTSIQMGYSHNLWLDTARRCGIIPFIFLILATIQISRIIFRLFSRKMLFSTFGAILVILFVNISTASFVEPVIDGNPYVLYFYTFIWGIASRYEENLRIELLIAKKRHEIKHNGDCNYI